MISRRSILQWGAAAPALFGVAEAPELAAALTAQNRIDALILDSRFAQREASEGVGVPVLWLENDITPLWYHTIDPRWRKPGFTLGGVTGKDALFVLEALARNRGRRVTSRKTTSAGAISWIIAPVHPSVKG